MTVAEKTVKNRKFKDLSFYDNQKSSEYFLLPFRFHQLTDEKEVIVNEVGDHLVVPVGTVKRIVKKQLDKDLDADLYGDLIANFFISETRIPPLIDVIATRYRTKKSFLDNFTTLHIFVMSLRCEHTCHYCQVSRVTQNKEQFDMARNHIDKGIDFMLQSPSNHVTMEFQGGEALLAFDNIVYAVERTKILAIAADKSVTYVICTNLALMNEDILTYCKENNILISSSLDGPAFIHNQNRTRPGRNSYELAISGIELSRKILGRSRVSALMTTTNLSLEHPIEIVEEYYKQGFRNMFLRPISPYGFAIRNEQRNKYETEKFLSFYKIALNRIIEYNLNGEPFSEDYATIILRKILTPFPVGYVDLNSPTGAITNVIAFNYNGTVYASDESRMLAEMKDDFFKLGHLDTHSYQDIFYGERAQEIVSTGINESLPGCSDCAFQAYCGADPIHNHATQGSMYGYRPTSTFCQKNMEIIRHLIELMDSDPRIKKIFESWVKTRY
jgi:His-Xaa-Ser system radical SAM maturase HxsB